MSAKSDVIASGLTRGSLRSLADGSFVCKVEQPSTSDPKGHGGDVGVTCNSLFAWLVGNSEVQGGNSLKETELASSCSTLGAGGAVETAGVSSLLAVRLAGEDWQVDDTPGSLFLDFFVKVWNKLVCFRVRFISAHVHSNTGSNNWHCLSRFLK